MKDVVHLLVSYSKGFVGDKVSSAENSVSCWTAGPREGTTARRKPAVQYGTVHQALLILAFRGKTSKGNLINIVSEGKFQFRNASENF